MSGFGFGLGYVWWLKTKWLTLAKKQMSSRPDADDDFTTTEEDTSVTIDVLANDGFEDQGRHWAWGRHWHKKVDPADLTIVSVEDGANGTATLNADGTITYDPDADFSGTDSFTYTIWNGETETDLAKAIRQDKGGKIVSLSLVYSPGDGIDQADQQSGRKAKVWGTADDDPDAFVLVTETSRLSHLRKKDILFKGEVTDGDLITAEDPFGAALRSKVFVFVFESEAAFHAGERALQVATFRTDGRQPLSIDDQFGSVTIAGATLQKGRALGVDGFDTATVTVEATPANDAPVAADDAYTLDQGTVLSVDAAQGVLANDTDPEGDALTASLQMQAANGTVVLGDDGAFTYTPDAGFFGSDSFTYFAIDQSGASTVATVDLQVDQSQVNYSVAWDVAEITEGTNGPFREASFTITRDQAGASATVTVSFGGTATDDFVPPATEVTFDESQTSITRRIEIFPDGTFEQDETVELAITNVDTAVASSFDPAAQVLTILNDDPLRTYTVELSAAEVVEGNAGEQVVTYTISRDFDDATTRVEFALTGTATEGVDFTSNGSSVTFGFSDIVATGQLRIIGDTEIEPDETIGIVITSTNDGGIFSDQPQVLTIVNDDPTPTYSVAWDVASVDEGDTNAQILTYTVTRDATGDAAEVTLTFGGTATDGIDYQAVSTAVTFSADELSETGSIVLFGDTFSEDDETVTVEIAGVEIFAGGPSSIIDPTVSTLTIRDDDGVAFSVPENSTFVVDTDTIAGLDPASTLTLQGTDAALFEILSDGVLRFRDAPDFEAPLDQGADNVYDLQIVETLTAGGTETQDVTVTVTDQDETGRGSVNGRYFDDLNANGINDDEPGVAGRLVELLDASGSFVATDTTDADGFYSLAVPDSAGTMFDVRFEDPGAGFALTTQNVGSDDTVDSDPDRSTGLVGLFDFPAGPGPATRIFDAGRQAVDLELSWSIASTPEGTGDDTVVQYIVTRQDTVGDVDVNIRFSGTAEGGTGNSPTDDYIFPTDDFTIRDGEATATINVTITGDARFEDDETIEIQFGTAGSTFDPRVQTLTILNDDQLPTYALSWSVDQILEGDGTTSTQVTLTATRDVDDGPSLVNFALSGTANAGDDFIESTGGQISVTGLTGSRTFQIVGDLVLEPDETIGAAITSITDDFGNPVAGNFSTDVQTLTILNDDQRNYSVTWGQPSVVEGDSGTTVVPFTISRDVAGATTSIDWTFGGTATLGSDFTTATTQNVFGINDTEVFGSITVIGDTDVELDETVELSITNLGQGGGTVPQDPAVLTITNDDAPPPPTYSVAWDVAQVAEGDSGQTAVTYTVIRDRAEATAFVEVAFSGTALSDVDFEPGTLRFGVNDVSLTFQRTVQITGDTVFETDETIGIAIADVTSTAGGSFDPTAIDTLTIQDDDPARNYSIAWDAPSIVERDSGTTALGYTVTRDVAGAATNVELAFSGSANLGGDFTGDTSATFGVDDLTATGTVLVQGDTNREQDETIGLAIASVDDGGTVDPTVDTATITDDDRPLYTIAWDAPTVLEGNTGSQTVRYTVTRDQRGDTLSINLDFSGTATLGEDFTAPQTSVFFDATGFTRSGSIQLNGDLDIEGDESVVVALIPRLQNFINVSATPDTLTIQNDDAPRNYSIAWDTTQVVEGDSGTVALSYTVTRDVAGSSTNVDLAFSGSANLGGDFTADTSIAFGANDLIATGTVLVQGDTNREQDETIGLAIASVDDGGTTDPAVDTATITDDDRPIYTVAWDTPTVTEGDSGTQTVQYTVTRDQRGDTLSLDLSFSGTAILNDDYTASQTSVFFDATGFTRTGSIQVSGDTAFEPDETIVVSLVPRLQGFINVSDAPSTLTVQNDDPDPSIPIFNYSVAWSATEVAEGNTGETLVNYTVARNIIGATATVTLGFSGTATSGTDYIPDAGSLFFGGDDLVRSGQILVQGDIDFELDESVGIAITSVAQGPVATFDDTVQELTITNDDPVRTYSITWGTPQVVEGDSGTTRVDYTISRSVGGQTTSIDIGFSGTATLGEDFTANSSLQQVFGFNDTVIDGSILVRGDTDVEADETVIASLTRIAGGGGFDPTGSTLTIQNDDVPPNFSVAWDQTQVAEGDSGETVVTYTVTRLTSGSTASVGLGFSGTATSGTDYIPDGASVFFAPTALTAQGQIRIQGDIDFEPDEAVGLAISSVNNGPPSNADTTVQELTITNDDPVRTYSFTWGTPQVLEGDSGTTRVDYTISRNVGGQTASVDIGFSGTATLGEDFTANLSVPQVFGFNDTMINGSIRVRGDTAVEADESVIASLTRIGGGGGFDPTGNTLTIQNDDTAFTYSVAWDQTQVAEGDTGETVVTYTVTRNTPGAAATVSLGFSGTATDSKDYIADGSSVFFGGSDLVQTGQIRVQGDADIELDETVGLAITSVAQGPASSFDPTVQELTITNDDTAPPPPEFTYSVAWSVDEVAEGNAGPSIVNYSVTRNSPGATATVTLGFSGTATSGTDYTPDAGSLFFGGGALQVSGQIQVLGDTLVEPDETVGIAITNVAQGPTAGFDTTVQDLTIQNDDGLRSYDIFWGQAAVTEGNSGSTSVPFTITRDSAGITTTVDLAFSGTATGGVDYTTNSSSLVFGVNETQIGGSIDITGDRNFEPDETIGLSIANVGQGGGTVPPTPVVLTVQNDDPVPFSYSVAWDIAQITEGDLGQTSVAYTVSRTTSGATATVSLGFSGTATNGVDYIPQGDSVFFFGNATSVTGQIFVQADTLLETLETVGVAITGVAQGPASSFDRTVNTLVIVDDDGGINPFSVNQSIYEDPLLV